MIRRIIPIIQVFVGGLDFNVDEDYRRQVFTQYGEIGYVKILVCKHCGFVQFISRPSAEEAIRMLNGLKLVGRMFAFSWGCSQNQQRPSTRSVIRERPPNSSTKRPKPAAGVAVPAAIPATADEVATIPMTGRKRSTCPANAPLPPAAAALFRPTAATGSPVSAPVALAAKT